MCQRFPLLPCTALLLLSAFQRGREFFSDVFRSYTSGNKPLTCGDGISGSGNYTYTWYAGDVKEEGLQGSEVVVTPVTTTTYTVVIADEIENKIATATITVIPKTYELDVPEDFTFTTEHVGYQAVSGNRFVIRNSGNVDVTNIAVSLSDTNAFTMDAANMQDGLAVNESTSFTIVPKDDLAAGNYSVTVTITGDVGVMKSFVVRFTVEDHVYESIVTEPTCTTKGYITHRCTICGDTYTDSETEMLPHVYKETWEYDETGHWMTCVNCGNRTEITAHTFVWVVDKEPTKKAAGLRHEECTVCGYKKTGVIIPAEQDVNTGVRSHLPLWIRSAIVSGIGLTALFILKNRNHK